MRNSERIQRRGHLHGVSCAVLTVALAARWLWAWRTRSTTTGRPPAVRTSDGLLLHTEADGQADGPLTVVFAHGFAVALDEYDAQRKVLRDEARLVLFDQRGHGRSGWGSYRSATIERLGRDLGSVIDKATGSQPVVVIGHSMGGMAVLALAHQRPELFGRKVVAVALLSTSAGRLAELALPPELARVALRTGLARGCLWLFWAMAPLVDLLDPFRTTLGRRWLSRRLFGQSRPPDGIVAEMLEKWASTPQSRAAAFYPAIASYDQAAGLQALRSIPTLVLAGTRDATIPADRSRRIARRIGAKARFIAVAGAGHMVNMTHAAVVNAALSELVERATVVAQTPRASR